MDSIEINTIKITTEELLRAMTIMDAVATVSLLKSENSNSDVKKEDVVMVDIVAREPQFLIGQGGKTIIDLQRILRIIVNKKLHKNFYLTLDVNNYQKQKIEYIKNIAVLTADEVVATRKEKALPPMQSYERRIVHEELSQRTDVHAHSEGEGESRSVVISPR